MVITESCKFKIAFESTRKQILRFCGDSGCLGDESKTGAMGVHEIRLLIKCKPPIPYCATNVWPGNGIYTTVFSQVLVPTYHC